MEQWLETNFVSLLASLLEHVRLQTKKTQALRLVVVLMRSPRTTILHFFIHNLENVSRSYSIRTHGRPVSLCRCPYSLFLDQYNIGAMNLRSTDWNCGTRTVKVLEMVMLGGTRTPQFRVTALAIMLLLDGSEGPHSVLLSAFSPTLHPASEARTKRSELVTAPRVHLSAHILATCDFTAKDTLVRLCYANARQSFLGERGKTVSLQRACIIPLNKQGLQRACDPLVMPRGIMKYHYSTLE